MPGDQCGPITDTTTSETLIAERCLACGMGLIEQPDGSMLVGVKPTDFTANEGDAGVRLPMVCNEDTKVMEPVLTGDAIAKALAAVEDPAVLAELCCILAKIIPSTKIIP